MQVVPLQQSSRLQSAGCRERLPAQFAWESGLSVAQGAEPGSKDRGHRDRKQTRETARAKAGQGTGPEVQEEAAGKEDERQNEQEGARKSGLGAGWRLLKKLWMGSKPDREWERTGI